MRNQALLEALEVEVAAVAQERGAVLVGANLQRVAAQQVQQLGESLRAATGDRRRENGGRADETFAVEAREEVIAGVGEEDGKAEAEEVGRVARVAEEVARDLEFAVAYGHEDALLVELGDELGERVELCVGKEPDKVRAVAGGDVVALEVEGDVPEGHGVTVDVEGADGGSRVGAVDFGLVKLAEEVLREIRGCCRGGQ